MPPKKDAPVLSSIAGYDNKETRILAAAFLSSIGPDKFDYPLFAQLTGFTEGTIKKFWPPVKKKAIENHENFGKFLGASGGVGATAAAPTSKANGKKRKAAGADAEAGDKDLEPEPAADATADSKAPDGKKKAPAKGKGRAKKVKTEDVDEEAGKVNDEENSADGGDGMNEV